MTRLPFLKDVLPTEQVETAQRAVSTAAGAKNELESRLLNALRRQRFESPGALAKFIKQDDSEVRDALNELVGRGLVIWQDESIGSAGAGYKATDYQPPEPEKSTKSNLRDRLGFR